MTDRILSLAHLTVIELSPPDVVAAAAEAGFTHVGLRLRPPAADQPAPPILGDTPMRREVRRRLTESGIAVLDAEIARLLPDTEIGGFEPLLDTAAHLGARFVVVSGETPERHKLIDLFGAFCVLARRFDLVAALEFMPWTAVRSLAEAQALTAAAGATNGRILLDAIHLDRAGETVADVAMLSTGTIAYCQLCDAPRQRPSDIPTMLHQARAARLPPGEGGLDLRGLVAALPAEMPISIEVPMRERSRTVPAAVRAAELLAATRRLLATSGHT